VCEIAKIKMKNAKSSPEKLLLMAQQKIHRLRSKKFFELMRHKSDDEICVCFDMEQNQPLPKLSVEEVFYSRQVWLYNLTVMINSSLHTIDGTHIFTWLETQSGRGANQVSSGVIHFLKWLDEEKSKVSGPPKTLRLFSDACSSQNKNSVMIGVLAMFLNTCHSFNKIQHFFPVRGHSYMPPDRVFGVIEKKMRKKESIVSPRE